MIWVGKYKYTLVLFALITLALGWLYFAYHKPKGVLNSEPARETDKQVKSARMNFSYIYQNIYDELQSRGIIPRLLKNHEILSQIFPKSKIWQFTNEQGNTSYLIEGEDKTARNVINDQLLTDKIVDFGFLEADLDGNKENELVAFTIASFKETALCCSEKRFVDIFKKTTEGKWLLLKEKELEVYYGGKHTGKIKRRKIADFPALEVIIDGYYYNGLKTSTVEWYLWQNGDFKQIWREHLFYNTDAIGTFSREAMDNYQAYFELVPKEGGKYPEIKVVKTYTRKRGRDLEDRQYEEIYYLWNETKGEFEKESL